LTNEGQTACYLFGYPRITLYDSQNHRLRLTYKRQGDQDVTSSPPRRVDLAVKAYGFVMVNERRCDSGNKAVATTLRLIPPDDTNSITFDIEPLRQLSYCGSGDPGSTLDISPVEPTESATSRQWPPV
jgi:hypothetical protein